MAAIGEGSSAEPATVQLRITTGFADEPAGAAAKLAAMGGSVGSKLPPLDTTAGSEQPPAAFCAGCAWCECGWVVPGFLPSLSCLNLELSKEMNAAVVVGKRTTILPRHSRGHQGCLAGRVGRARLWAGAIPAVCSFMRRRLIHISSAVSCPRAILMSVCYSCCFVLLLTSLGRLLDCLMQLTINTHSPP